MNKHEWKTFEYNSPNGGIIIDFIRKSSNTIFFRILIRSGKNISLWCLDTHKWIDSGTSSKKELYKRFVEIL